MGILKTVPHGLIYHYLMFSKLYGFCCQMHEIKSSFIPEKKPLLQHLYIFSVMIPIPIHTHMKQKEAFYCLNNLLSVGSLHQQLMLLQCISDL